MWKEYPKAQSRLGKTGLDQDWRSGTCQSLPLAPRVPQVPRLPSLCCSESEDSIDFQLNSETSFQVRRFFFSATRISHRDPMYCSLSFNSVLVQTLPTEQVTPALTDSSSRGHDPYTHACKARPLTTVGWTSLSVIVIVIAMRQSFSRTKHICLAQQVTPLYGCLGATRHIKAVYFNNF